MQFSNLHTCNINSLSSSIDGHFFLSCDAVNILHWNLERNKQAFSLVDIKPDNMLQISEALNVAEFSPFNDYMICYGTSKGVSVVKDLRENAGKGVFFEPKNSN